MGDMSNLLHNATVDTLLERRSIRKFKSKPLGDDVIETLETVAQHAASSQFLNDWSAIRVTDPAAKKRLAEIGGQPYIATAPLLYVFVLDEHRNAAIASTKGVDTTSDTFTLNGSYRYSQAQNDAVLALHAMETAAYSLGLGCVILGSLLNDVPALIDLLNLPEGCPFAPRCDAAMKICLKQRCGRMQINDFHQAACWVNIREGVENGSIVLELEPAETAQEGGANA